VGSEPRVISFRYPCDSLIDSRDPVLRQCGHPHSVEPRCPKIRDDATHAVSSWRDRHADMQACSRLRRVRRIPLPSRVWRRRRWMPLSSGADGGLILHSASCYSQAIVWAPGGSWSCSLRILGVPENTTRHPDHPRVPPSPLSIGRRRFAIPATEALTKASCRAFSRAKAHRCIPFGRLAGLR
jgi:hypothetical protein